jgi:hypothetical protein
MRCAAHAACRKDKINIKFWSENLKGRGHLVGQGLYRRIIFK